jgi:hypothetical protein
VVVLAALSLAPLVVAHHVLFASIAHASDYQLLCVGQTRLRDLLHIGEGRGGWSRRGGADRDESTLLRAAGSCG